MNAQATQLITIARIIKTQIILFELYNFSYKPFVYLHIADNIVCLKHCGVLIIILVFKVEKASKFTGKAG